MDRRRSGRAMIAAASLLWCTAAAAQDGASTRELVKLPPQAANRTVQKDLLSVLEPVRQIRSGMFRQLHGVNLATKAYGTEFDGVCCRDELSLRYAPTEQDSALEDAPVRPYPSSLDAIRAFSRSMVIVPTRPSRTRTDCPERSVSRSASRICGDASWTCIKAPDRRSPRRSSPCLVASIGSRRKTYRDIAEELGISEKGVTHHMTRALAQCRKAAARSNWAL